MRNLSNYLAMLLTAALLSPLCVIAEVEHRRINSANELVQVTDESWQPGGFVNGTVIPAAYIALDVITVDGRDDEAAWNEAEEVAIALSYGAVKRATVKVLYTDEDVMIRVRWADDDEDRQYRPWMWDEGAARYVEGTQTDDSVLLSFEAGCEWTPSLLGGYIHDFDGWHWLAARSDPLGQAVDLYGNVQDREIRNSTGYASRVTEDDWLLKFVDREEAKLHADWDELDRVYMRQPVTQRLYVKAEPDGVRSQPSFVARSPAPAMAPYPHDANTPIPQYTPVKLTDGAGEVQAKGQWSDGYWTVEFQRARVTPAGFLNDTKFTRLTQFSVHVFDRTERVDEASESGRLFLRFLPEEQAPVDEERNNAAVAER